MLCRERMPAASAFAKGFHIRKGATISGWKIQTYTIQHVEEIRFQKYRYPIIIHLVSSGKSTKKLSPSSVQRYLSGSKTIYSQYGNPYKCTVTGIRVSLSTTQKTAVIKATGHAVKSHGAKRAGDEKEDSPLWLVAIRYDNQDQHIHRGVWLDFYGRVYVYDVSGQFGKHPVDFESQLQPLSKVKAKLRTCIWNNMVNQLVILFQTTKPIQPTTTVSTSQVTMAIGVNLFPDPIQIATEQAGVWNVDPMPNSVSTSSTVSITKWLIRLYDHFFRHPS